MISPRLLCRLLFLLLLLPSLAYTAAPLPFALATDPVPVFSHPVPANKLPKADRCGQIRELEFIALPGTLFSVLGSVPGHPDQLLVTTSAYRTAPGVRLFVDRLHLTGYALSPEERQSHLPRRDQIQQRLASAVGLPYIWGGNIREGIRLNGVLQFQGLDCSGLLYEATDGFTPRNTSQLVSFGTAVSVAGLAPEEIARRLQPLDLIVWDGHLVIVLDEKTAIESILRCKPGKNDGVILTPLIKRLRQICSHRTAVDQWPHRKPGERSRNFVVRRWLPVQNE